MEDYQTMVEAIKGLKEKGYTHDFNLESKCLTCEELNLQLYPEEFSVKAYYRFEGMSNPSDNSIVYAIASDSGVKGILVDAYGTYSEALSPELAAKLGSGTPNVDQ